jgi:SAM-dependent methyltransferase
MAVLGSESESHGRRAACELCSSPSQGRRDAADGVQEPEARGDRRDEFMFSIAGYDIVRCGTCGLMRTSVPPGFAANAIYTEEYFQGSRSDGYCDYLGSEAFLVEEYETRIEFIRSCVPAGRLLEVGCATGGFLAQARKYFSVQGVDVSKFAVQAACRKGLDVECSSVEESTIARPPYDAVVLFDTLEHLKSPGRTLAHIHSLLAANGRLFLTTGDARSLLARVLGKRWRLMTPPQHLWFFDRRTIVALLERLEFRVLDVRYLWRRVPVSLAWYQLFRGRLGALPFGLGNVALPVNLYDTMTIVAGKLPQRVKNEERTPIRNATTAERAGGGPAGKEQVERQ